MVGMPVVQGPDPTDVVGRRVLAWLADGFIGYLVWLGLIYALGIPQSLDRASRQNPDDVDPNTALAIFGALAILVVITFGVRVVLIGTFGGVLGLVVGIAFGAALVSVLPAENAELTLPLLRLGLLLVAASALGVVASALPARRAGRLDVLHAIAED